MSASPKDAATGERAFLATCSIGDLAAELDGMAAPWPMALSRVPKETDEEYLARVAPYLDNEGRARVQEALSERLSAGGLAVPPGGDS